MPTRRKMLRCSPMITSAIAGPAVERAIAGAFVGRGGAVATVDGVRCRPDAASGR